MALCPQLLEVGARVLEERLVTDEVDRLPVGHPGLPRAAGTGAEKYKIICCAVAQQILAFSIEFVALANHRKVIRVEIARYAERFCAAQLEALTAALAADGIAADQLPPIVALLMMTGLSQVLALEEALGVTAGHEATISFVQRVIDHLEPAT
jgi:hypothetical protein